MQAEAIISNDTTPIILRTEWYESYEGKVQGALQASAAPRSVAPCSLAPWLSLTLLLSQVACQESPISQCVAVCIDGGMTFNFGAIVKTNSIDYWSCVR